MTGSSQRPELSQRVPPDAYSEEYFLRDCEGFDVFQESSGRRLSPRLQMVFELARVRPGQWVLDIGCGRGELLVQAGMLGAHAVGIDYAAAATRIAARTVQAFPALNGLANVARMDATRLALPAARFDTVVMSDVVEHLYPDELDRALDEVYRVLKPTGRLVIHTAPNRLFARWTWPRYVRHVHRAVLALAKPIGVYGHVLNPVILRTEEEFPLEGDWDHVHVNEQTPDGLVALLRQHGFERVTLTLKDPPKQPLYSTWRYNLEVGLLDMIRFLWPLSNFWPLNRLFALHIWVTAERP